MSKTKSTKKPSTSKPTKKKSLTSAPAPAARRPKPAIAPVERQSVLCFWNNKGGTGKTSLAFQSICGYAAEHADENILAIDMCPQANLSELLLGGLTNHGSDNLLKLQASVPRTTVGGYFEQRLPNPYNAPSFNPGEFIVTPSQHNNSVPKNIDLVCGDPLLELQVNAMSTLANTRVPGVNSWLQVMSWLRDFLAPIRANYSMIFIDANPSFSVYTQMALAASDELVIPVMADDSSRRAVQNVFSLVYGMRVPSPIYTEHAFGPRLTEAGRALPKVRLVVKNRLTQYMGPASAYADVLSSIEKIVDQLVKSHPSLFSDTDPDKLFAEVRDFQTTGVVAFAKGLPFSKLQPGRIALFGERIRVNAEYLENCREAMDGLVALL